METIDYPTRKDLVSALLDFRKRGIHVDVVHNGLTLAIPEGVGLTLEEGLFSPVEHEASADGVEKTPVEGDTLLGVTMPEEETPMDRSTFTVEGTCSECGQPAIAEPEGNTWVHVDAANHADNEGHFVPNEQVEEPQADSVEEKVEDLIGNVEGTPKKRTRNRSQSTSTEESR